MAYYEETATLSTGPLSLPSHVHDPESDRFRLGRELARDFGNDSFSSNSSRGGGRVNNRNNNNNNNDETDTLGSFDIARDARGMSARKADMLQHTPTIDSRLFSQEFADFSMPGQDEQEITDSLEIGRGGNDAAGMRSADFSSHIPFSIGGSSSGRKQSRRLTSFFSAAASPGAADRLQSLSSVHSDPSEYLRPSQRRAAANKQKEKARSGSAHEHPPPQRTGSLTGFDLSQIEVSTPKNAPRGRSRPGDPNVGTGVSKISDFVSNSGSGGSRSRFQGGQSGSPRDDHGDTASDAGSVSGRARPLASRFGISKQRQVSTASAAMGGTGGTRGPTGEDITGDIPTIVAKARRVGAAAQKPIPTSFKSTDAFLQELGLDGHTTTTDMKARLENLKDADPGRAPGLQKPSDEVSVGITQQSFLLPQMSDLSELISGHPGDATRFSRKRAPGTYGSKTHKPLESIPVPHDERAILTAMRLLQDKVASLEGSKAEAEQECLRMEFELRRAETRVRQEQQRTKAAEESLARKRSGDSAFGGSNDGDAEERAREKQKLEHQMERLKLETTINSLRTQLDNLTRELETARIALRNMQEERNSAVNSVALAISTNQDLKAANEELCSEIEKLRQEYGHHERRDRRGREEWEGRVGRLRRKARDVRDATAVAEGVIAELAKRDNAGIEGALEAARVERREQRLREKEAQRQRERERERLEDEERRKEEEWENRERATLQRDRFDEMVQQQLRKLRPDLFIDKPNPSLAPLDSAAAQQQARHRRGGKQMQRKDGKEAHSKESDGVQGPGGPEEPPVKAQDAEAELGAGAKEHEPEERMPGDDTVMSISQEEIRRIAKEINVERRKRKAAAANAAKETEKANNLAREAAILKGSSNRPAVGARTSAENLLQTDPPAQRPAIPKKPTKTVKIAKSGKGKGKAVETPEEATTSQALPVGATSSDTAVQTAETSRKPRKGRVIKKHVVYIYDDDTTMTFPREIEQEVSESEDGHTECSAHEGRQRIPEPDGEVAEDKPHEDMSYEDPLVLQPEFGAAPPAPAAEDLPENREENDVQSIVDHLAEHDPEACTVCKREEILRIREEEQRMANPLADIDNSMAAPAPPLESVSARRPEHTGAFEEEPTPRPSQQPRKQLSKVVRQLQDEFTHMRLTYQNKADAFMRLDPSVGKRRRKALTGDMNELVAEMDYKCDQIYALYDVNEGFEGEIDPDSEDSEEEGEEGDSEQEEGDDEDVTEWTIPESFVGEEDESEGEMDDE